MNFPGRYIVRILTYVFVLIGAATLLGALAFGGFVFLADQADKAPLSWPNVSQDCVVAGHRPLNDRALLEVAMARWNADEAKEGKAYRRKYVGGPVIRSRSIVEHLNVIPDENKSYAVGDLETNPDLKVRYRLAKKGLRDFVRVTLALEPSVNPARIPPASTATRIYILDSCGTFVE